MSKDTKENEIVKEIALNVEELEQRNAPGRFRRSCSERNDETPVQKGKEVRHEEKT
jgi:hypothetical protein